MAGKRGRPTRAPTDAEREKVKELVASEAPIADIAKLFKRSIPNLRKYFSSELDSGKKRKAEALPFKPTKTHREKVARYVGCKMTPEDVARVLDITVEQLEANFADELKTGAAKARANVLDHLHDQMAEGLVGATNKLEALTSPTDPDASSAKSPGYVGKKVAARVAADHAVANGGAFAPPSGPRLAVNNDRS